jgi:hypothetical protein
MVLALALTGCVNDGTPTLVQAQLSGPTIAFESIDGPPLPIFQKLVAKLSAEAEQRRILVVSRAGQPAYRVRGYLAALLAHGRTHIGWVWDVYDAQRHRAFRIAGEEVFPGKRTDAWALLDDAMLARIAATSMDALTGFLTGPETAIAAGGFCGHATADDSGRVRAGIGFLVILLADARRRTPRPQSA